MENKNLILYQREDCPFSQLIRKKMTLLNLPCLMIPVDAAVSNRAELKEQTGQNTIPALVDKENIVNGVESILTYLEETYGTGDLSEMPANKYTLSFCVEGSYEPVLSKVGTVLSQVGFQVICKNDLSQITEHLGYNDNTQMILQIFDEDVMPEILREEPDFSVLIPFNLVIRKLEDRKVCVSVISPVRLMSLIGRADLVRKIAPVKSRLNNFFAELTKTYKEIS